MVLAAHYDTKDLPGFVGANDGAGGTAAVLEAARSLRRARRPASAPELRFVLFDGEESPRGATDFYATGLRGSKAYAARHAASCGRSCCSTSSPTGGCGWSGRRGPTGRCGRACAPRRGGPGWRRRSRPGSARRSRTTTRRSPRAGVPAVDLIDFDYPWWHTPQDTPDKLSARSLDAAGEAVVELLRTWR